MLMGIKYVYKIQNASNLNKQSKSKTLKLNNRLCVRTNEQKRQLKGKGAGLWCSEIHAVSGK